MKLEFEWDSKKEEFLQRERGISFKELAGLIVSGNLLSVRRHPNPEKYPNQMIFIVRVDNYAWVVPFEKRGNKLRLITAYPSRKWTKFFLRKDNEKLED